MGTSIYSKDTNQHTSMSTHIFTPITDRFGYGKYLDLEIVIDNDTKYINASKLCQLGGKKLAKWLRLDSAKILLDYFNNMTTGPDLDQWYYEIGRGDIDSKDDTKRNIIMGTYFHRKLIVHIAQWISCEFAMKVSGLLTTYETALYANLPGLNTGLPSFITDKINVNMPLNALNDLIGHIKKEITPLPKPKMIKIESYEEILSRKVRDLYSKIMPPDYYEHIKDIDHPEDIREVLICLAGKLGIDIIVKEEDEYGLRSYNVYFQWNSLPSVLGYEGTTRQIQAKAAAWKFQKWVDDSMFVPYKNLKSFDVRSDINDCSRAIIATSSSMINRDSNSNDWSGPIIKDDALYVKIDGLTKLLYKCDALDYKTTMLQSWIDTTLKVSKFYCQLASDAHAEYNTNYTKQLKDLHYREIASINEIPIPTLSKGYLYIGTDPNHLAKCQYKLGMTSKPVKTRLSSSQTTNPDYYYIYSIETKEPNEAEHILHTMLTKIGMKVTKEWYQLPSEEVAITLVNKVVEIVGCLYDDEYIEKFIQSVRALQLR